MIALVFSTALISTAQTAAAPLQLLAGPAFEALARKTDAACPDAHIRFINPGDLDWEEDTFEDSLKASDRARFKAAIARTADGGPQACAGRDGLSCPVSNNLKAIAKAGQMKRFVAFACVTKPPR